MHGTTRFAVAVLAALAYAPDASASWMLYNFECFEKPPKPGEHLGDHLIADRMPPRLIEVKCESRVPTTTVALPPHEEPKRMGGRIGIWHDVGVMSFGYKIGELPPKIGESFGDYTIAPVLPPRYLVRERGTTLPETSVPLPPLPTDE